MDKSKYYCTSRICKNVKIRRCGGGGAHGWRTHGCRDPVETFHFRAQLNSTWLSSFNLYSLCEPKLTLYASKDPNSPFSFQIFSNCLLPWHQLTYHWSCYLENLFLVLSFFQMMFPEVIIMELLFLFCCSHIMIFIVKVKSGTGEISQQLWAISSIAEDLVMPSKQIWWLRMFVSEDMTEFPVLWEIRVTYGTYA